MPDDTSAFVAIASDLAEPSPSDILTPDALAFLTRLHRTFEERRRALLAEREEHRAALASHPVGAPLGFPALMAEQASGWQVAPAPPDLLDRRVEITGPVERRMMINALNCGAKIFMSDLEDSLAPSWQNVIQGQINLYDAVRRTITFDTPEGRKYRLNEQIAVLLLRPRGWHLPEKHVLVDGDKISASLFDFGLYFFHNAKELLARGSG